MYSKNLLRETGTALDQANPKGEFTRKSAYFTFSKIDKTGPHPPEQDRYHLYIAYACPWANGTLTALKYKGLEDTIGVSIVHPVWNKTRPDDPNDSHCGWIFKAPGDAPVSNPDGKGEFECDDHLIPDTVNGFKTIRDLYEAAGAGPTVTRSTPVLWDKKLKTIVNNESTQILQIFNEQFNDFAKYPERNLYPSAIEKELVAHHDFVYNGILNGVYRSGFAQTQAAYEKAVTHLFESLDRVEYILQAQRYLGGNTLTWVDLRLFHTLVRFDPVYHTYFKCNIKRLEFQYPVLLDYIRDIYQTHPAFSETLNLKHIKMHYYASHPALNPRAIIPFGNGPDLTVPQTRHDS